jgi:hypothetical protein
MHRLDTASRVICPATSTSVDVFPSFSRLDSLEKLEETVGKECHPSISFSVPLCVSKKKHKCRNDRYLNLDRR